MYPIRTLAGVLFVIAGLAALDQFLARTERAEVLSAAERSWQNGKRLLREGHAEAALDELRNAHSLVRDNIAYELDMIAALVALARTAEADPLIDEVLLRKPNDGPANLTAARLKAKERDVQSAEAFYHRAIYGEWTDDAPAHRRDARLELVQMLAGRNSRQELVAELISLEAEADGDDALRGRVARLFLDADSLNRAADVYRSLIEKNPDDAEAYEGLGEAEMRQGQYRAARAAFVQVSYRHPGRSVAPRLILLNEVIQLDPTPRRLPTAEKYDRSLRILALAKGDLAGLLTQRPGAATAETARLMKAAADIATGGAPRTVTNELAERNLDFAEQIWKLRVSIFGPSTGTAEEALRLTMERLVNGS
jgi:tetratricopeptide (TPR) repeat protein